MAPCGRTRLAPQDAHEDHAPFHEAAVLAQRDAGVPRYQDSQASFFEKLGWDLG